ncbi:MAG: DUF4250 domain-containing protein [Clostridiales bacterium]|nr:DUF4250 domain-containing protein [Clostridiales bacterium]
MLPKDPLILVSVLNTKLRDSYANLSALCDDLDLNEKDILASVNKVGYSYNKKTNRFIAD